MRSRMYLSILGQRDGQMRNDFEDATDTGAVGRFRCTTVGSSSSSSGSESGFSYTGRSSASDPELSSISSIEMTLEVDWALLFGLAEFLLLTDFDNWFDNLVDGLDAGFRSLIELTESLTLVRLLYHCPSELFMSSALNVIRLSFESTSSEKAVPTIIPKNRARCDEAARRFETAWR